MKWIFILFFLVSCSPSNTNDTSINKVLDFNKNLTFQEFNDLLIKYTEIEPYPNIDQ